MEIQHRFVIVTGASRGLGRAISEVLVAEGAIVFGFGRSEQDLKEVKSQLGESFHPILCDLQSAHTVKQAMSQVLATTNGRIDVLINNAGLGKFGAVEAMSEEDWDVQVNTNLKGVFLCIEQVVPIMKQQNAEKGFGGNIINID